jgi:hypothetical protein
MSSESIRAQVAALDPDEKEALTGVVEQSAQLLDAKARQNTPLGDLDPSPLLERALATHKEAGQAVTPAVQTVAKAILEDLDEDLSKEPADAPTATRLGDFL